MVSVPSPPQAGRPLRILEVLEPSGGGSGRHFLDLCRALAARGHHVEAIYSPLRAEPRFVTELEAIGLARVHAVAMARSPGPSDLPAFLAIRRILGPQGRFDIVHGHSSKAGALTRLRLPGVKGPGRVYTPHAFRTLDPTLGRGGRLVYGAIEGLLGRFFTGTLIAVSGDEYSHALGLGIPERRLRLVVNGVETPPVAQAEAIRAALNLPPDAFLFGFVGRLSAQKAPERLIGAFSQVAAIIPQAHLLMVGSGELEPALRRQIAASSAAGRIHLTDTHSGPEAIPTIDALVMPSRYEAMSYVMLEAAAAGKPIVATAIGGASTVIEAGVNGLIVDNSDDLTALASAMKRVAEEPLRSAMARAAQARRDRWSLDVMVDRTEAVYRALAGER
ncbi:glycosyltransferase [Ensifer soli]|uniref:glycosyltransferase n=1 Tax=Ciceribacter sp. sgz301302 TaxID=3342379 RepID=UPI0035B99FC8